VLCAVGYPASKEGVDRARSIKQTICVQDLSLLSQMADAMPQLVWIDAPDGRPQYVNRRWCEYTGQTVSQALTDWTACLHPQDRKPVLERLEHAFQSGHTYEARCRYRRHDGEYRWFLNRAAPAHDSEGRLLRWFGTATDIHDLVETKDQLRAALKDAEEHRRLLDVLMEHIPVGVVIAEVTSGRSELVLRRLSRFARELTGQAEQQFRALLEDERSSSLRVYDADGSTLLGRQELPLVRAALNGDVVQGREMLLPRKDGGMVPVLSSAAPIYDRANRIIGAVSAWQDITERKEAEKQLVQSQKMESVAFLAAGVAHTFNNLLTPILGYANMLHDELPPRQARLAEHIIENSNRAAELVRRLLDYAGKGQFVIRPVDISESVRLVSPLLEASLAESITLQQDLEADLPPIAAVADQIDQMIVNLVRNAAEAIPEGRAGTVTVRTRLASITASRSVMDELSHAPLPPCEYVCLEVLDDGSGIDQSNIPKLFDPFFTTKFTGRGLGLPAAAGVVRAQRGGIEVQTSPGQGTLFRVYFPVNREQPGD
jgi:PAS domain S-box-containing protein